MPAPNRRRAAVVIFIIPMIVLLSMVTRIGDQVRTVDFLQIFGGGMILGVCLMGLIQQLRSKGPSNP